MSVLLTACKAKAKPKPKSATKKKKSVSSGPASPPISTDQTVVWYFQLQGCGCTLMLNKQTNAVWCNGEDLETVDRLAGGGDGSRIDFDIIQEDGSFHNGRIEHKRNENTKSPNLIYELKVNGQLVVERTHANVPNQYIESAPAPPENTTYMYGQVTQQQQQQQQQQQHHQQYQYDTGYDMNGYAAHGYDSSHFNSPNTQNAYGYGYAGSQTGAYGELPPAAMYDPPPKYEEIDGKKKKVPTATLR